MPHGDLHAEKIGRAIPEEERNDFNEIVHDVEYGVARIKTILSDLRGLLDPMTISLKRWI